MKRVTVAGSGVLGSQIAFQCAFHGCDVVVHDVDAARIEGLAGRWDTLAAAYRADLSASDDRLAATVGRLRGTSDLADAADAAELVIEAIPEVLEIKTAFYRELSAIADEKTILVTNSSTLRPSDIAPAVTHPERFLALHFANEIWKRNTAEIMGHPGTDRACFDAVVAFAVEIGMVPLPLYKEQPGYILNSLLVPLLNSALMLAATGVADVETIDRTWMIATRAPNGPFATLDVIGLRTPYNLVSALAESGDPTTVRIADWLKADYIDKGRFGVETGHGFYDYPDPAFLSPDFLGNSGRGTK